MPNVALVLWLVSLSIDAPAADPPAAPAVVAAPAALDLADLGLRYGAGVAAGVVVVPLSLALGTWLGTTSSNLVAAALPALLVVLILPPVAMTLGPWWAGNRLEEGSARLRPALWVAAGVHLAVFVAALLLGASSRDLGEGALVVGADALLVPLAVTATMHWTRPPPALNAWHDQRPGQVAVPLWTGVF